MPAIPDTAPAYSQLSTSFLDVAGRQRSSSIRASDTATPVQIEAWHDAVANASNAFQFKKSAAAVSEILRSDPAVIPFDEAFASVHVVGVIAFQNGTTREIRYVEIPAVDASVLTVDGAAIDPANPLIQDVITSTLDVLGDAPNWFVSRAFLSNRSARSPQIPFKPASTEPVDPQLPPESPGENPGT